MTRFSSPRATSGTLPVGMLAVAMWNTSSAFRNGLLGSVIAIRGGVEYSTKVEYPPRTPRPTPRMLNIWTLFAISTGYVAILFVIAYFGDRHARIAGPPARKPWVYSLALCVYCTSWTFYGAVGRAASSGWDFLPI